MRKGSVLLLALVAVAVALLATTAQAKTKQAAVSGTVTLSGWSSGADEDNLLQQVVDKFMATHPSIKVDYTVINGSYTDAMTARFAAHNPPDVFYVDSSLAATWAQQGVLQPLDSYIKSSKYNTKAFFPSLLNTFKVGGKIYGFPKDWSPLAMEINTTMLSQAGIKKAPTTWAQLQADAQTMVTKGVVNGGTRSAWARIGHACSPSSSRTRGRSRTFSRRRRRRPSTSTWA